MLVKRCYEQFQVIQQQGFEHPVSDVPRGDQEQLTWLPLEDTVRHEVGILGYHDARLALRAGDDRRIGCAVSCRELERVDRAVAAPTQRQGQPARQLGIDQPVHATTAWICFTSLRRAAKAK